MGEETQTYQMVFLAKGGPQTCPVEGCPGQAATRTAMRDQFIYRHVLDTMVILEEGNLPHPRCTRCSMMVPRRALNGRYPATSQCARGEERNRRLLAETELRQILERAFELYGEPLENVTAFRYLGRVLTAGDDDWLAVLGNLGKARKSWGRHDDDDDDDNAIESG